MYISSEIVNRAERKVLAETSFFVILKPLALIFCYVEV